MIAKPVGMVGYPGYNSGFPTPGDSAKATMQDGIINRVTDFSGNASAPSGRLQFVQHSAPSFGGFSGSPLFLPNGRVIAINNSANYELSRKKDINFPHEVFQVIPMESGLIACGNCSSSTTWATKWPEEAPSREEINRDDATTSTASARRRN